jgi:HlyD family secretion protein
MVRPGLSCTARIATASRQNVLSIPVQALTVRQKGQLQPANAKNAGATQNPAQRRAMNEELQGVFVIKNGKAVFQSVKTGISGNTDIEVLEGLSDGEQIVTGSYQVIRTIRNEAKVKIDNKPSTSSTPVRT